MMNYTLHGTKLNLVKLLIILKRAVQRTKHIKYRSPDLTPFWEV